MTNPDEDEHADTNRDGLDELRRLVEGLDRAQIVKLRELFENPAIHARDVSRVLPEAISDRASQNSDLASALSSTINEAFKLSARRDPQPLIDALSPVIGPAIRKAVSDAIMRMMQSLNHLIEYSLSAKSWRWRLEARRTGKSFGEIVLLHTLVYRVEQVFLVDRQTSLLLLHVAAPNESFQDADSVSSMLVILQNYVKRSFGNDREEALDEVRVGEHTVWSIRGPLAMVAAVVWGMPRLDLKMQLMETCERIHAEHGEALRNFQGDVAPFEVCRPALEACLVRAGVDSGKPKSKWPAYAFIATVLLGVGALIFRLLTYHRK